MPTLIRSCSTDGTSRISIQIVRARQMRQALVRDSASFLPRLLLILVYSIQYPGADGLPSTSHVQNAAPTRPPSRANNRSPLGRLIDLQAFVLLAFGISTDLWRTRSRQYDRGRRPTCASTCRVRCRVRYNATRGWRC